MLPYHYEVCDVFLSFFPQASSPVHQPDNAHIWVPKIWTQNRCLWMNFRKYLNYCWKRNNFHCLCFLHHLNFCCWYICNDKLHFHSIHLRGPLSDPMQPIRIHLYSLAVGSCHPFSLAPVPNSIHHSFSAPFYVHKQCCCSRWNLQHSVTFSFIYDTSLASNCVENVIDSLRKGDTKKSVTFHSHSPCSRSA